MRISKFYAFVSQWKDEDIIFEIFADLALYMNYIVMVIRLSLCTLPGSSCDTINMMNFNFRNIP